MDDKTKEFLDNVTHPIKRDLTLKRRNLIEFCRVRPVKLPTTAYRSAGVDFYVPTFTDEFVKDVSEKSKIGWKSQTFTKFEDKPAFILEPGERINIPSGICCKFNRPSCAFVAFNKSGIAVKKGLTVGACVVDEDYTGEVHLSLINTSNEKVTIAEGDKIVQFLLLPILAVREINEVSVEDYELYKEQLNSERGDKWCGSSNIEKSVEKPAEKPTVEDMYLGSLPYEEPIFVQKGLEPESKPEDK